MKKLKDIEKVRKCDSIIFQVSQIKENFLRNIMMTPKQSLLMFLVD